MNRRSFFGTLFAGFLARFLPCGKAEPFSTYTGRMFYFGKPAPINSHALIDQTRIDFLDSSQWGQVVEAENCTFEGCVVRTTDPAKPSHVTFGPTYIPSMAPKDWIARRVRNQYIYGLDTVLDVEGLYKKI